MEIRHLNTFIKIAMLKNFTHAAKSLGYCQSNVSMHIQQLERELGIPLFDRIGKNVSLTQYGEELLPYAQKIVSMAEYMENLMKKESEMSGTVKIGIVESLFDTIFEPVLTSYHKRFPNVKIDIMVDATSALKEKLKEGAIDFACLIDKQLSRAEWNCLYSEKTPIFIIANPHNILFNKKHITLQNLENLEFILMEDMASYSRYFQQLMHEKNIKYRSFLKLQSASMARKLVESSDFLSVLPYYSIKKSVIAGKIKIVDADGFSQSQFVQVILHPNKVVSPQSKGFLEELGKYIKKFVSTEIQD